MNKLEITKKVATFVVGVGTSKIAQSIIQNNVSTDTVIAKVTVNSAALVIGMMASEATKKFTNAKIDEYASLFADAKDKIKEAQEDK